MKNKIILVVGGARSGKSGAAERMVKECGAKRFYIATMPVFDGETADRVELHRQNRAADHWVTIEEQLDLTGALRRAADSGAEGILVDCLTLWINNLLYRDETLTEREMAEITRQLVEVLRQLPSCTVLVINEVGLGLVPESPLARRFRDLSGRCAQIVAAAADEVYFMVAGIKQRIK